MNLLFWLLRRRKTAPPPAPLTPVRPSLVGEPSVATYSVAASVSTQDVGHTTTTGKMLVVLVCRWNVATAFGSAKITWTPAVGAPVEVVPLRAGRVGNAADRLAYCLGVIEGPLGAGVMTVEMLREGSDATSMRNIVLTVVDTTSALIGALPAVVETVESGASLGITVQPQSQDSLLVLPYFVRGPETSFTPPTGWTQFAAERSDSAASGAAKAVAFLETPEGAPELSLTYTNGTAALFRALGCLELLPTLSSGGSTPPPGGGPPPPPPPPSGKPLAPTLPTAVNPVSVSNASQLTAALAAADAGTRITLANGAYSGNFTLSKDGTAANPIVVVAATPGGATMTGRFTLAGNRGWLQGVAFSGSSAQAEIQGADCKVVGSTFANTVQVSGAVRISGGADRAEVCFNTISAPANRGIVVKGGTSIAKDAYIHNNYVHGSTGSGAGGTAAIIVGEGQGDTTRYARARIIWNLIEGWNTGVGCVEAKSCGNRFHFNTLRDCRSRLEARHGAENEFIANTCLNSGGPCVWGWANLVVGNINDGVRAAVQGEWFRIGVGTGESAGWPTFVGSGSYQAGTDNFFSGNTGPMQLGIASKTYNALRTRLEAHTGTVTGNRHSGTVDLRNAPASVPVPTAVTLNPADVGPGAM